MSVFSGAQQEKINALIEQSDDPKDRAFLIVLQQINSSLIANTETINSVAIKLDSHLSAYERHAEEEEERRRKESARVANNEKLRNQGIGAWRALAIVLAIFQSITGWVIVEAYQDHRLIHSRIADHSTRITVIEEKTGIGK